MSTASSGAARERLVRHRMGRHGWLLVARSAASKGAADLVMVHPTHGLALVQVGTANKGLSPADRDRLVLMADLCSAVPLIATTVPGVGVWFRQVTREPAGRWLVYEHAGGVRMASTRKRRPRQVIEPEDPARYETTLDQLVAGPVCPECAAGKHVNCVGQAWDNNLDRAVTCLCPSCGIGDS